MMPDELRPGGFTLGRRSRSMLVGVDERLRAVVFRAIAITPVDFVVIEGLRTKARQAALVKAGASRTMNSYHLTGHAVDLGAILEGKLTWRAEAYRTLAQYIKAAAQAEGVAIQWGGDWKTFVDMPHWQVRRG